MELTTPCEYKDGEMELNNLLLSQRSDIIAKFISMMSSSEDNRHFLIKYLLLTPITDEVGTIKLDKIDNYNRDILDTILKSLGTRMVEKEVDIIE